MSNPSNAVAVRANGQPERMTPAVPAATRTGQGTAVEQSRAIAEVEAAIVVAMRHPRNLEFAENEMKRSCSRKGLAEQAFFRFPRAGQQITGPSIHLARELARCWGNVQYGIVELRRDDEYGQSEMLAYAWDVQTNTRSQTTFIVPHLRDTRGGSQRLTDARDVYENNANMGARRVREMIFAIMPGWYTEAAVSICYATLEGGDDGTLPERIERAVKGYAQMGITVKQLEARLGAPRSLWQPTDVATLGVIFRSIQRAEVRKEDEFPAAADMTTGDEILGQPKVAAEATGPQQPAEAEQPRQQRQQRRAQAAPAERDDPGPADPGSSAMGAALHEHEQRNSLDFPIGG